MKKNNIDDVHISFLIPTNRRHKCYLDLTINSIKSIASNHQIPDTKYEILVSSIYECANFDNVKFFIDIENNGSIGPINFLASQSVGKILCVLVDDYIPSDNLFSIVDFFNSNLFENRRYKVCTLAVSSGGRRICAELTPPSVTHPFTGVDLKHNRNYIVKFPVMDRKTYEILGRKIFHPSFIHHCADNYLAIYLGNLGEPVIECSHIVLDDWAGRNSETKYDVHETLVLFDLVKNLNEKYYDESLVFDNIDQLERYFLNKR